MTTTLKNHFKCLALGNLDEVDHFPERAPFRDKYPLELIHVEELDRFVEAIERPDIDFIVVDVAPYGLDVIDIMSNNGPMRPVIMVAHQDHVDLIIEAKRRGLERYVIRLDDPDTNIDLLYYEARSVVMGLVQPPSMEHPTVENLFRYAHYHNVRQPFFVVDKYRSLLYINEAGAQLVETLHGQRVELGSSIDQFYLEEDEERFRARLDRAFDGEEFETPYTFEALAEGERHREILYQPVSHDTEKTLAVSIACKNIGAKRAAEERLIQREETLWAYFDDMPLPMKVMREDLVVERCNHAFASMVGVDDREALHGASAEALVHPDDQPALKRSLSRLFEGEGVYFQGEHRYVLDGDDVWASHIGFVFGEEDEGRERVFVVAVDITAQKEAERRAERAMRMEAVGELAGGVAHDFNNVLGIVGAIGHLLEYKLDRLGHDDLVGHVQKIERAVKRGAALTHQLLHFSQDKPVEKTRVELNEAIRDLGELLDRALGGSIEVEYDLDTRLDPVELGAGQIDQVLMNLAVNARDAMPGGGTLVLRTAQEHIDTNRRSATAELAPGDWVVLQVCDTGEGMDEETRRHIFEPFYTTKGVGKGTGLGLATVYRVVDAAGGEIYVDSAPGEGTAFTIYLPVAEERPAEQRAEPPTALTEGCVLLVEDEDDLREPYRLFLETAGYQVIEAAAPDQARQLMEEHGEAIDLLLSDIVLDGETGADLAEYLLTRSPDTSIVLLSGYAPDIFFQRQKDVLDLYRFLPKPVARDTLLAAVSEAIGQRRRRAEPS